MSSKAKERTAMAHARALCAKRWPGAPVIEARPKLSWFFDKRTGRRVPRTVEEDIFGAFDLVVVPLQFAVPGVELLDETCPGHHHLANIYLQVTTYGKTGAVSDRKRKVRDNFLDRYPGARQQPYVYVIAWEAREHFHVWHWSPSRQGWLGPSQWEAPLPKKDAPEAEATRASGHGTVSQGPGPGYPFD